MMKRATAALYCELSIAGFEREIAAGRLPIPVKLDNTDHWCRVQLDEAIDLLTGRVSGAYDWEKDQPGLAA